MEIRTATKQDLPEIYKMISELAEYEKALNEVTITIDDLEKDGFGENPLFNVILACEKTQIIGMAFYFISYSTWKGKCIYLEDIIVKNEFRGKGIGKILFEEMILISKKMGAKRLSWQVLDWNEPAIRFYKKFNASLDNTWLNGRLTDTQMNTLKL